MDSGHIKCFRSRPPPWFLGGMFWWPQLIYLVLSLIPFILLFIPMGHGSSTAKENLIKLIRFPVFWLGLLFLLYITIQGLNPSWNVTFIENGTIQRATKLPESEYITWLPTSVSAPFTRMNPWRVVIVYATALMFVCSIWVGIRRRRSLVFLLSVFVFNVFLVAILLILQKMTGATEIYWVFKSRNPLFGGPFIYRNHTSAYLMLGLGGAISAFSYYLRQKKITLSKSDPRWLFFALGAIILLGILYNASRGGVLFNFIIVVFAISAPAINSLIIGNWQWKNVFIFIAIIGILLLFLYPISIRSHKELVSRFNETVNGTIKRIENGYDYRINSTLATFDMFSENYMFGWGAGSFRYIFRKYQKEYKYLYYASDQVLNPKWMAKYGGKQEPVRIRYNYAHDDIIQNLAEYGLVGSSFLYAIVITGFLYIICHYKKVRFYHIMMTFTSLVFIFYSFIDFVWNNPSDFYAFCMMLIIPCKFINLKNTRNK